MDVVPALEADWRSDPFALVEDGDRYVGRGTADMKGFLALATNRLAALDPTTVRRPLALLFTYDEETGTLGARRFTETWPEPERLPREIVIGEPTEMRVVRAHKGLLRLRLHFAGIRRPLRLPHLGHNAIEPAARAIVALRSWAADGGGAPAEPSSFPESPRGAQRRRPAAAHQRGPGRWRWKSGFGCCRAWSPAWRAGFARRSRTRWRA